jgi:methionyl-tRNA synthetase
MKGKYYITTAIAYTSGKPHIGNTYEAILTDSIARFKRRDGYDVFFQTGTDEHGQKIEEKAKAVGKSPKQFVDEVASGIKLLWDMVDVSYDKFMRTTDDYHERAVAKIFKKFYEKVITHTFHMSRLFRAKQISRTSYFKVTHCNLKA